MHRKNTAQIVEARERIFLIQFFLLHSPQKEIKALVLEI